MENGVLWNRFRAQCGPHFFSSHGKANGQTLEIILNAPLKPLFWFTFWLTRTLDKFVGTKSRRRHETSLLFSHPGVCSPPSSPGRALSVLPHQERSTAPALQLFSGVASFLAGHLILRLDAASTRAQRALTFLQPGSPPPSGPPCVRHSWEHGRTAPQVKGPSFTQLLLLPLLREHLSKHHSHNKGILHKLIVSILFVN